MEPDLIGTLRRLLLERLSFEAGFSLCFQLVPELDLTHVQLYVMSRKKGGRGECVCVCGGGRAG